MDGESENEEVLMWSKDPEERSWLSDWKIEIVTGERSTTYNVHRSVIAVGPKKSEYFACLLKNEQFAESDAKKSRIVDLHEQAAAMFGTLLDFVYGQNIFHGQLLSKNTAALYHLADYFGVKKLAVKIKKQWQDEMKVQECGFYFRQAQIFRNDLLMKLVLTKCAKNIAAIKADSELANVADYQFWLDLLRLNNGKENLLLSDLVAEFCWKQEIMDTLSADAFDSLTSESHLPFISTRSAAKLLKLDNTYVRPSNSANALSSLQRRCVEALALKWKQMDALQLDDLLKHLNPLIISYIWSRTMELAKAEIKSLEAPVPSAITVSGSGKKAISGSYAQDGQHDNYSLYTKFGQWKHKEGRFQLFVHNQHWYLSFVPAGSMPGKRTDVDFFRARLTDACLATPPQSGWSRLARRLKMAPTLTYHLD